MYRINLSLKFLHVFQFNFVRTFHLIFFPEYIGGHDIYMTRRQLDFSVWPVTFTVKSSNHRLKKRRPDSQISTCGIFGTFLNSIVYLKGIHLRI